MLKYMRSLLNVSILDKESNDKGKTPSNDIIN